MRFFVFWFSLHCAALLGDVATGKRAMVATVDQHASAAALRAFENGGNAIDAAVAAGLTLGVTDGFNSGIGGGCFMLIHLADGTVIALDGREMAPAAASRDMFLRNGAADPELSQTGPLAVGIPGSVAVYEYAVKKFGKLPFKAALSEGLRLAREGFPITDNYAARIRSTAKDLQKFPGARALLFDRENQPLKAGARLTQADLAAVYRNLGEHGSGWFYKGAFAETVAKWMKENGGIITAGDFAAYKMQVREPLRTTYRGFQIIGFPPPSSGGLHVAQILNILERFDLAAARPGSARNVHLIAEAMKIAFADRAYWLGDPDFVQVPRGLISKDYANYLAEKIKPESALELPAHNTPPEMGSFEKHTTHFATADAAGNWVACTATINTTFGAKVVVPGTGVFLNNQMDDFAAQPGVPNFFGLLGAEANSVAAGKRPLSSMSPTIVLKEGKPILSLGAAGGPTIITQVLLGLIHVLDHKMDLEPALKQPRFHHQWRPDSLKIERAAGDALVEELQKLGHKLDVSGPLGATQGIAKTEDGFVGVSDPRGRGQALGW